ncbi:MAG: hypothetical protein NC305_04975 [Lachnospiraceae bacterium]|nr:hypothetical protein [Muribaculum sp.]MCM1409880.1 hypothetical protein [Lachnospiraceae bacterium]
MNKDKLREKDKILQVMEKYQDYFKEWNADVAFGVNKRNIFYVLAPRNEFETFLFFQTADQLEKIILGTIAENVEIIMEAGMEEIATGFSADKMDGEYGKSIEHYLPGLVHKLDVISKAGENWQNMMTVTFNSLKNVCTEIAEKEHKNQ